MQQTAQYFGRHCSFGCGEDNVTISSIAKVLISVVERRLSLFVCQNGVGTSLHQVFHDQVVTVSSCNVKWGIHLLVSLLIYVLALADNDADKVKFAIVASLPYI